MIFRMTLTCFKKCVATYKEGELQVGEMTCTDRCVGKYMQASDKIGEAMKKYEELAKLQQKASEEMLTKFK